MSHSDLTSIDDVFAALGGVEAVARLTGSKRKAAGNWKYLKAFPARTYVAMTAELTRRGQSAPPRLWKMVEAAP